MSAHFARAQVLFQQRMHDLAERELKQELALEPENAPAHALLALCLAKREQYAEATREAEEAVRLSPLAPYTYFALAGVLTDRRRFKEAEQAITMAISLDPEDADYWSLLAGIRYNRRRWKEALEAAERGLALDAEHIQSNNIRAMALIKLGRKQEAGATIQAALARDPENAITHANQGWALLEQSEPKRAMEHFREALRLDPECEWARIGIVEALKARHLIYRLMLRYFLWMAKLSRRLQWVVLLSVLLGQNILIYVNQKYPQYAPVATPLLIALLVFLVLSWIADPLFNLLLRLSKFGRLVLSRDQTRGSNVLGACLLGALGCFVAGLAVAIRGNPVLGGRLWAMALELAVLTIPASVIYRRPEGWTRRVIATVTIALTVVGPCVLLLGAVIPALDALSESYGLGRLFFSGVAFSTWLAVGLTQSPGRR